MRLRIGPWYVITPQLVRVERVAEVEERERSNRETLENIHRAYEAAKLAHPMPFKTD